MNELVNTNSAEELANPVPASADESKVETVVEETVAAVVEPTAEAESDDDLDAIDTTKVETSVNYHEYSKEQLLDALKGILDTENMNAHKEVALVKQCFYQLRNREIEAELAEFIDAGNQPEAFASTPDETEQQFKELLKAFKEKRAEYLAAKEAERRENLVKKQTVLDKMRAIVDDIDNINLHFQDFQQLQQDFKAIKEIPESADAEVWKNYQAVVELFYDRLKMNKELRDLDFRKNLEVKKGLIEEANKLTTMSDVIAAFRKLQDLHLQWREVGPVAKEQREEIWNAFKEASTIVNKRHQDFFETRKAEEAANEAAKTALCEELEGINIDELKSFSAWDEATKKVIDMQARWKQLGFASRKVNNLLFTRFREMCDKFFAAKAAYFKQTKDLLAANLAKKTALCEQAEALKEQDLDLRKATEEVARLQAEWKKVGAVPRKQSDAIWKRFTTACNYFYEERKRQLSDTRKVENENLAAKREIIAKLKAIPEDIDRNEGTVQVRELQAEWQKIGHVPFKMKDRLYEEYRAAANALYEKFNIRQSQARMSNYENRIADLDDDSKLGREQDRLYRQLEQKRQELRTYENNLGFFNIKSSSGSSMLQEMERRANRIKDEMKEIQQKIDLLDSKMSK